MNTGEKNTKAPEPSKNRALHFFWRNMPRLALISTIFLIIILMVVISGEKKRLEKEKMAAQAQGPKPVNTVLLELQPTVMQDAINLPGIIESWVDLELMAKINGTIQEVLVKEGDVVKEGDLLARIEPDDYRIALDSAKAGYALAKADYERAKVMVSKKAMPVADLQNMETKMATARASVESAALKLSRCSITAPMSGVISRLNVKVGLYLGVGDPIGQMLQIDRVKAVVGIPESDVDAVRKISEVNMTIQALDNRPVTGKMYFLAPAPDSFARVYRLELEVDNSDGAILPGMFLRAHVVKKIINNAVAIPLYSVISRNDDQFVFVARDGVVHKKPVKLGIVEKWQVQVTEGLDPGERVVVEGHRDVEDGQEIEVIKVITDPGRMQL